MDLEPELNVDMFRRRSLQTILCVCLMQEEKPPKNAERVKTSKKSRAAAAMGGARQLPLNSFFKTLKEESGS